MNRIVKCFVLSMALLLAGTTAVQAQQNSAEKRGERYEKGTLAGGVWHAQTKDSKSSLTMRFQGNGKVEAVFVEDGIEKARMSGTYTYDATSGKLDINFDGKGFETTIRWQNATRLTMTGTSGNQGEWLRKSS
jgi:hypothetical protein